MLLITSMTSGHTYIYIFIYILNYLCMFLNTLATVNKSKLLAQKKSKEAEHIEEIGYFFSNYSQFSH